MEDPLHLWKAANSFRDLCNLGARFIEGEAVGFPGWLPGELDEESDAQAPLLARAQRAGFLTLASQPGIPPCEAADGRIEQRRAFVFGFAEPPLAERLIRACQSAKLWTANHASEASGGETLTVATRGEQEFLCVGDGQGPTELELFEGALGPGPALEALRASRYLVLADPAWGRDDLLWPTLERSLG